MKRIFTLLIAFYSITSFAQKIKVLDEETGFPISDVAIYNKSLLISTVTDSNGIADLSDFNERDILIISHVSYTTINTSFANLKNSKFVAMMIKKNGTIRRNCIVCV